MPPSDTKDKPLRQLAVEKLHGKGSNPSQLGDPISLKAETSESFPSTTKNDNGPALSNGHGAASAPQLHGAAEHSSTKETTAKIPESSGGSHEEKMLKNAKPVRGMKTHHATEGEAKAEVGGNGKGLGDPTSLKSEGVGGKGGQGDNGPSRSNL